MIPILFSLLFYQMQIQVYGPYAPHSDLEFGFEKGGLYDITVKNPSSAMVFGLLSKAELNANKNLRWDPFVDTAICEGRKPVSDIQKAIISGGSGTVSGTIQEKGVYTPFYYGCVDNFMFQINLTFRNANSCLDYRQKPSLIVNPLFIALFSLLLILWLVNWFTHFTLEIKIHYFLTTCFTLALLMRGLYYGFIENLKKNGFISGNVYIAYNSFAVINDLFFFLTLLLAAQGWYIITRKLKYKTLTIPAVFGALYIIGNAVLTFVTADLGYYEMIIAFASIICLAVYVYFLVRFINENIFTVSAHVVVIKNQGIDPKTTPIYQKYKMYRMYYRALITYCICKIITMIATMFAGSTVLWLPQFLEDLTYLILMCFLFWIFMIRQRRKNGYLMFDEGEAEEFSTQDLEGVNPDQVEGGREWDEETPLPPLPNVMTNISPMPYGNHNNDNNNDNTNDGQGKNEKNQISVAQGAYSNPSMPVP